MKRATKRAMILSAVAGATAVSVFNSAAQAQTAYTWSAGSGVQNWTTGWGVGYPNVGGDTATISGALGGNLSINLDAADVRAGVVVLNNTSGSVDIGNLNSTGNPFNFHNVTGT